MGRLRNLFWLCLLAVSPAGRILVSAPAPAAPTIAAASDLQFALDRDRAGVRPLRPVTRVELVFGSSGNLTRQIQDGAPFEVFLAADEEFREPLADAGSDARCAASCTPRAAWCMFAPTGSPLVVDEQIERARARC